MASERPSVALALIGVVLALSAVQACGSPAGSQGGAAEGGGGAGGSGGTGGRGGGTDAPPTIRLVTPHGGESLSGEVMVRAEAADDSGIASVSFEADELPLGEVTAAPFEVSWDTAGFVNGNYRLRAIATDLAGQTTEALAEVFVVNGTGLDQPPSVRIFYPLDGSRVCGTMDVQAAASDDEAVVQVEFFAAGTSFATSATAPHRGRWDTASIANGAIALEAVATDTAGQRTRHRIEVVVANGGGACDNLPSVVLTSPGPGSTNNSLIALAASASDDVGVVKVQFFVDNGLLEEDASVPYEAGWHTDDFPDGPHVLKVLAYDTAGQTAEGVVEIALDRDDPTVRITEPATGARVLATFDVEVEAADASGIAWVELSVDGRAAGRVLQPPYTFQVTAARSGEQLVLARAADSAGNERVDQVVVDVDAPPQVVITAPASGAVVSGELRVRADVTDDRIGPYRVTFRLDGALLGIDASSPFDMTVPICDRANGPVVLEAIASDASNQEARATVAFEIQTDRPRLLGAPGNGTVLLSWDMPCGAAAVTGYRLFWDTASPVSPSSNVIDHKEVATYAGVLAKAHEEGLSSLTTVLTQVPNKDNGNVAIVTATVITKKGTFTGIGDASATNVNRRIGPHIIRMAETRAKARALRDAVNIGVVSLEELGGEEGTDLSESGDHEAPVAPAPRSAPQSTRTRQAPAPATQPKAPTATQAPEQSQSGNGNGNGGGNGGNGPVKMTENQRRWLFRAAAEIGYEGEAASEHIRQRARVVSITDITKAQASKLIDAWKPQQGNGASNGA